MTVNCLEVLRKWRLDSHLTMLQAAYRLDVGLTTYSAWENGRHKINNKNRIRVSAETGIPIDALKGAK